MALSPILTERAQNAVRIHTYQENGVWKDVVVYSDKVDVFLHRGLLRRTGFGIDIDEEVAQEMPEFRELDWS